jgi:hypothetical protein
MTISLSAITGVMLGFEFATDNNGATYFVLDLLIIRIIIYRT